MVSHQRPHPKMAAASKKFVLGIFFFFRNWTPKMVHWSHFELQCPQQGLILTVFSTARHVFSSKIKLRGVGVVEGPPRDF
jgi:hypothetical protein